MLLYWRRYFIRMRLRDFKQVPGIPENLQTTSAELDMAVQLIDNLTTEFKPDKYTEHIQRKAC